MLHRPKRHVILKVFTENKLFYFSNFTQYVAKGSSDDTDTSGDGDSRNFCRACT